MLTQELSRRSINEIVGDTGFPGAPPEPGLFQSTCPNLSTLANANFTSAGPFTWKGAWSRQEASGRAAGRARPPNLRSPGHPRPPNPLPGPEVSLSPGPLSTAWSPVAQRGPRGPRGTKHPPRSMAATLAAARVTPPPPGREGGASVTAQWAVPGGRENGRRLGPRPQSQLGLCADPGIRPPLRAHARSHLSARGIGAARPTAPPIGPRPPTRQQAGTRASILRRAPPPPALPGARPPNDRPLPAQAPLGRASLQFPTSWAPVCPTYSSIPGPAFSRTQ